MSDKRAIEKLMRADLLEAGVYTPIRPPDVLSRNQGIAVEDIIKLDGNENPYGCSTRVRRALADYRNYHVYPDPEQQVLRSALQQYTGVNSEHILAGAGSDELIDLILRLLLNPGDEVINCSPTFGMYPFSTEVCAGRVVTVMREEKFTVNPEAVLEAITPRTKAIFVASPNNPTGNVISEGAVQELLNSDIAVIVDEAYFEFSGETTASLVPKHDNLVVLRSFSKWAGLAGLRVGYGIFPSYLVPYLMKMKQPYNVNAAAQVAALESLADMNYLQGTVQTIIQERERLLAQLRELDFLQPYPTEANFILCRVINGRARQIHERLQQLGIFLRYFDTPLLQDCIRISVGKPEHTDAVIQALKELERA